MRRCWHQHQVREAVRSQFWSWQWHIRINVCIDYPERRAIEQRQCAFDAATGVEDVVVLGAVHDLQAELLTGTNSLRNFLAKPAKIDNDRIDFGIRQSLQLLLQQAGPSYLNQRLWQGIADRAQSLAPAGSKNHCSHYSIASSDGNILSSTRFARTLSSAYRGAVSLM